MTLNSATVINKTNRLYSDSGAEELVRWIQSPVNRQIFQEGDQIVNGIFVKVVPAEVALSAIEKITQEFVAWETASDQDFLDFEEENF